MTKNDLLTIQEVQMYPKLKEGVILRARINSKYKSDADRVAVSKNGEVYLLTPDVFRIFSSCDGQTSEEKIAGFKEFVTSTPQHKEIISLHEHPSRINSNQIVTTNGLVTPCRRAIWHLTRQCNMHCAHCYYLSKAETKNDFSADEINKTTSNLAALGVELVRISGGEATLDQESFELAVNGLTTLCIPIVLNTNGWKWNNRVAEIIQNNPFVRAVQVSLDGTEKAHNALRGVKSHSEIASNITWYRALGIHVRVISMLTDAWTDESSIKEACKLIANLGVTDWVVEIPSMTGRWAEFGSERISDIVRAAKVFYAFLSEGRHDLKKFTLAQVFDWPDSGAEPKNLTDPICSHDLGLFTFGPEGVAYCTMFAQQFGKALENLGQSYSDQVADIWNTIAEIRMSRTISENPACRECELFPVCQGGCPGQYLDAPNFKGCDVHSQNLAKAKLEFSGLLPRSDPP